MVLKKLFIILLLGGSLLILSCTQTVSERERSHASQVVVSQKFTQSDYVRECQAQEVDLPAGPISCADGTEIPLILQLPDGTERPIDNREDNELASVIVGEHPVYKAEFPGYKAQFKHISLLTNMATPHSRIRRLSQNHTDCVLYCRKNSFDAKPNMEFTDINMICSNRKSGATCFFNTPINEKKDGTSIPTPASKDDLTHSFWGGPEVVASINCSSCHAAYPFFRSPFVKDLVQDGEQIVPALAADAPYKVVAEEFFKKTNANWQPLRSFTANKAEPCTSCHRLGNLSDNNDYCRVLGYAVGTLKMNFSGREKESIDTPSWYAMPPKSSHGESMAEFTEAVKTIGRCCKDGSLAECTYAAFE